MTLTAAAAALATIDAFATAVHPAAGGASRTGSVIQTAIFAVAFGAFAYAVVHNEHRLRHLRAAAENRQAIPAPPPIWAIGPTARRHGPTAQTSTAILMLAGSVFGFYLAVSGHAAAAKSHLTQAHGTPTVGVVEDVRHVAHHGRYSTWYTALLTVQEPTGAVTEVHDPQDTDLGDGSTINILVDPSDPNYAELPGRPAATTSGWVIGLLFALTFTALDVQAWRALIRMRRQGARGSATLAATPSNP